jgi:hypothetical protein
MALMAKAETRLELESADTLEPSVKEELSRSSRLPPSRQPMARFASADQLEMVAPMASKRRKKIRMIR